MRKKATKAVKRRADGKVDGRTKAGKAAKARVLTRTSSKKVVDQPKRKYTRRTNLRAAAHQEYLNGFPHVEPEVTTPKKTEVVKYTQTELDEAKSFFQGARYEVSNTIKDALRGTPRNEWNKYTHVNINHSTRKLNTEAVAAALGI